MGFTIAVYGVFSRTEGEVLSCLHGLLFAGNRAGGRESCLRVRDLRKGWLKLKS